MDLYIPSIRVDPKPSFSTIQFHQEALNDIALAALITFITVNVTSIASKLMLRSKRGVFEYRKWLRAYIFANSDDPMCLISWIRGKRTHLQEHHHDSVQVSKRKIHIKPLITPLLVRWSLTLLTVISIAVSVPGTKELSGCSRGDHRLVLDDGRAKEAAIKGTMLQLPIPCWPVSIESNLGTVASTITYCSDIGLFNGIDIYIPYEIVPPSVNMFVYVRRNENGKVSTYIQNSRNASLAWGFQVSVGWVMKHDARKEEEEKFLSFLPGHWDQELHGKIVTDALAGEYGKCQQVTDPIHLNKLYDEKSAEESVYIIDCEREMENATDINAARDIEKYFRGGLKWERLEKNVKVPRAKVNENGEFQGMSEKCPVVVNVQRPVVNILAMSIVLAVVFLLNLSVTIYLRKKHDNIMDDVFQILNEVLLRDTTCNPLQIAGDSEDYGVKSLNLKSWKCSENCGHVSFLHRSSDREVNREELRNCDTRRCMHHRDCFVFDTSDLEEGELRATTAERKLQEDRFV